MKDNWTYCYIVFCIFKPLPIFRLTKNKVRSSQFKFQIKCLIQLIVFFHTKKHRLPLITLSIVSTIPLKMAFQNTVGKGENASNNFLHVSQCLVFFFFFTFPSVI